MVVGSVCRGISLWWSLSVGELGALGVDVLFDAAGCVAFVPPLRLVCFSLVGMLFKAFVPPVIFHLFVWDPIFVMVRARVWFAFSSVCVTLLHAHGITERICLPVHQNVFDCLLLLLFLFISFLFLFFKSC
uniref:Uncharacterized protein n=1 Tax=Trypanosoma congolense (strain IL3000) TaxID=1068625 RepID=G0UZD6_TRYCI|nr:hypothetical protein, unlikely [Trypanosoma congolense IL3000]